MKVGEFMWHWIRLEEAVNTALLHVLGVSEQHKSLLKHFISFSSALGIIETAIPVAFQAEPLRKTMAETVHEVRKMYSHRNTVAHSLFGPIEGKKGVAFWDYKAKKEVKLVESFWSFEDFDEKMREMESLETRVKNLGRMIGDQSKFIEQFLAEKGHRPGPLAEFFIPWPDGSGQK